MKIKYRRLPNPDEKDTYLLMGMAFIAGEHRMTAVKMRDRANEKLGKKIIKRAFAKYRNSI